MTRLCLTINGLVQKDWTYMGMQGTWTEYITDILHTSCNSFADGC